MPLVEGAHVEITEEHPLRGKRGVVTGRDEQADGLDPWCVYWVQLEGMRDGQAVGVSRKDVRVLTVIDRIGGL